jgi:palmitoyltransferase ZDHHC9/14/18
MSRSRVSQLQSYGHSVQQPNRPNLLIRLTHRLFSSPHYSGRNIVLCNGALVTGYDVWVFVFTNLLIITPITLFAIYMTSWLWNNGLLGLWIAVIYLAVVTFASFLFTSLSDPGIIPRRLDTVSQDTVVHVDGQDVELRYCETCQVYRPPRASHCRICDNCIQVHDHHCVWVNNCIGARNYRSFITFLVSSILLALGIMVSCGLRLFVGNVLDNVTSAPACVFLFVDAGVLLILILWLSTYHLWLMMHGLTTHEHVKLKAQQAEYPDCAGRFCYEALCRPREPALAPAVKNDTV